MEQIAVLEQAVDVYTMELERFLTFIRYNNAHLDVSHAFNFWVIIVNNFKLFYYTTLVFMQNSWKLSTTYHYLCIDILRQWLSKYNWLGVP